MTAHECSVCHEEIPAHQAVIRSVSLRTHRAWCRSCWQLRAAVVSALLPTQRVASERVERMSA